MWFPLNGGGTGGPTGNKYTIKNILKIGSTSLTGNLTLNLTHAVNKVTITGYIHAANCNLKVGDATVNSETVLTVISKDAVDNNQEGSVTIECPSTTSLYIGVQTKVAIYITSITFYVGE